MSGRRDDDFEEPWSPEVYVNDDGELVDASGRPVDDEGFPIGNDDDDDDYDDDGDDDDDVVEPESEMSHRQSIALVLEVAPIGAELVFCRNVDPEACAANNHRAEKEDIEPCPSCAVIEMTDDLTVDQIIQLTSLN